LLSLGSGVSFERAGRRKLAQLVAHHILSDVDRNVSFAVVHATCHAHHFGRNRRTPRPGADHLRALRTRANTLGHLLNALIGPSACVYATWHTSSPTADFRSR